MPEIPPNSSEAMAGTKTIKGCVACASSWLGKTKINDLLFHSHWAEITNNSLFLITEFFFSFLKLIKIGQNMALVMNMLLLFVRISGIFHKQHQRKSR